MDLQIEQYLLDEIYNREYPAENAKRYVDRYVKFIAWCLNQKFDDPVLHRHHIVPRSWNEKYLKDKKNLVAIPVRYHIFAHILLAKTRDGKQLHALSRLMLSDSGQQYTKYEAEQQLIAKALCRARAVINLDTGEVFESSAHAGRKYGVGCSAVGTAIKRRIRLCGCYWHYKDVVDEIGIEAARAYHDREIDDTYYVWNLNTKTMFINAREAAKSVDGSNKAIYAAIERHIKYKGSYWAFNHQLKQNTAEQLVEQYDQEHAENMVKKYEASSKKNRKRIIDTTTGIIYEGVNECAKQLGLNNCTLSTRLTHNEPYKGHWFKYVEDDQN